MVGPVETPRFMTPADVADVLATTQVQVMALIRRGDLRAIQIGGRGQWRVEASELENYIARQYERSDARQSGAEEIADADAH
jgi:excisionase family DNA binding protein